MHATRRSFRTDIVMQMRLPAEQQAQKKAKVAEIQALKERLEEAEGEEDAAALTVGSPVPEACISLLLCAWLCVACTFQRGLCGVKEELKEAGDAVALALGFPVRAAGPSVMLCCVVQPSCTAKQRFPGHSPLDQSCRRRQRATKRRCGHRQFAIAQSCMPHQLNTIVSDAGGD